MLNGLVEKYQSQNLSESTRRLLGAMLTGYLTLVCRWKNSRLMSQQSGHIKVYDILNAGPRSRFVVNADMVVHNCVNRIIQSSGHDALVIYLNLLEEELNATHVPWSWFIVDFHDETMVQCKQEDAPKIMAAFRKANLRLNEILGGNIPLRIEPKPARDLSEAKLDILTTLKIVEELDDEDDTEESD